MNDGSIFTKSGGAIETVPGKKSLLLDEALKVIDLHRKSIVRILNGTLVHQKSYRNAIVRSNKDTAVHNDQGHPPLGLPGVETKQPDSWQTSANSPQVHPQGSAVKHRAPGEGQALLFDQVVRHLPRVQLCWG